MTMVSFMTILAKITPVLWVLYIYIYIWTVNVMRISLQLISACIIVIHCGRLCQHSLTGFLLPCLWSRVWSCSSCQGAVALAISSLTGQLFPFPSLMMASLSKLVVVSLCLILAIFRLSGGHVSGILVLFHYRDASNPLDSKSSHCHIFIKLTICISRWVDRFLYGVSWLIWSFSVQFQV